MYWVSVVTVSPGVRIWSVVALLTSWRRGRFEARDELSSSSELSEKGSSGRACAVVVVVEWVIVSFDGAGGSMVSPILRDSDTERSNM